MGGVERDRTTGGRGFTEQGASPHGEAYRIEVPARWNGTLLLYSQGLPMQPGDPAWNDADPLFGALLDAGYAVAGTGGGPLFWPLEPAFTNQEALLDRFARRVGAPEHTVAWGLSIGGTITAGLVQRMPERLSGALPICGNLAGAVATHNRELDVAFVVKVLLGGAGPLDVVRISDPVANPAAADALLRRARGTPEGRARLGLAAAVGGVSGWHDPLAPAPRRDPVGERLQGQLRWFEEVNFLVYFHLRWHVERRARGNPSWNDDVDYRARLEQSADRDEVEALYDGAGIELDRDLEALASAPRIRADPDARAYLERNIVFSGDLGDVPVVAVHTEGDGLVPADHEEAYAAVVHAAGQDALLRQLFLHRGGHGTVTPAEVLVALRVLLDRVVTGSWPVLDPATLNATVDATALDRRTLGGRQVSGAYAAFSPRRFPRRYDGRDVGVE